MRAIRFITIAFLAVMVGVVTPIGAADNKLPVTEALLVIQDCAGKFGKTGKKLPALIADAVRSLPAYMTGEGEEYRLVAEEVVFLPKLEPFTTCINGSGYRVSPEVLRTKRMFSLGVGILPIFVNGEDKSTLQAMVAYSSGGVDYLRFTFARYLGHEVAHIVLRTNDEMLPLAYEEGLIRQFLKEGKLPPECVADLENVIRQEKELPMQTLMSAK